MAAATACCADKCGGGAGSRIPHDAELAGDSVNCAGADAGGRRDSVEEAGLYHPDPAVRGGFTVRVLNNALLAWSVFEDRCDQAKDQGF
jgi:hypothetical protein